MALRRSPNRKNWLPAGAACAFGTSGACSKATAPTITEASVWVFSVRPLAFSVRSIPLAFQKRDCSVTSLSYGASMKTFTDNSSCSGLSV